MEKKELTVGVKKQVIVDHLFDLPQLKWYMRIYYRTLNRIDAIKYFFRQTYERVRYGFKLEEAWDFKSHHASYCVPRLKRLKSKLHGHPTHLTHDEWAEILDKIIWAFENVNNDPQPIYSDDFDHRWLRTENDDGSVTFKSLNKTGTIDFSPVKEHTKRVDEGLELFAKYYRGLWD